MQPAGAGDVIMRVLSEAIEKKLGQPLVIDARGGGGGMIGANAVASAAPDGHTLMMGATNNFVINQFMFRRRGSIRWPSSCRSPRSPSCRR